MFKNNLSTLIECILKYLLTGNYLGDSHYRIEFQDIVKPDLMYSESPIPELRAALNYL